MLRNVLLVIIIILTVSFNLTAHEGHEQTPGSLRSNHGGVVKAGSAFNLEYVFSGNQLQLYPSTHEGKDIVPKDVILTATYKMPKGKPMPLPIILKEGTLLAMIDFKTALRLEISIVAEYEGKKNTYKFQVEK